MKRNCPVCKIKYEDCGDSWKKKCYDCYKNYKNSQRIKQLRWKENVYVTHPSVTKEELDKWIVENGLERGWGVKEINIENYGKRYRIWFDNTNFD
jgi:protein-arginine kinase activator protein McsA